MKQTLFLCFALLLVSSSWASICDHKPESCAVDVDGRLIPPDERVWRNVRDPRDPDNLLYLKKDPLFSTHVNFTKKEKIMMGIAAGAAIIAFASEQEMLDFVQEHDGEVLDKTSAVAEVFGSRMMVPVLGAGYVLGMVIDNDKIKKTALLSVGAMALNVVINDSLKQIFRRALPRETSDPFAITESNEAPDMGMPSGHTTSAFAIATVIAEQYGNESKVIPVLAYGLASLTAWSRVYDNQHWASDVFIGAIVGHFAGKVVAGANREKYGLKFEAMPYVRKTHAGIMFQVTARDYPSSCKKGDWECFRNSLNKKK